jgi:DNA-binding MarR family transcriptional regulator
MFGRKLKYTSKHNNQDMLLDFCVMEMIKNGDQKLADLSEKLFLNLPAMSEKIAYLESQKMLTKETGFDKREKHLKLTAQGLKYLDSSYGALNTHCLTFLNVLSETEKKSFDKILAKLIYS